MTLSEQIAKALANAAERDMRLARERGGLLITGTMGGNLALDYRNGSYRLVRWFSITDCVPDGKGGLLVPPEEVLAEGAARFVKPVLMGLYCVVVREA